MRVYVETTVFQCLCNEDELYALRQDATKSFFEEISQEKFFALGSDLVMEELEQFPEQYKDSIMDVMDRFNLEKVIVDQKEMQELTKLYVKEGIIPKNHINKAQHVAIATIGEVDVLATWDCTLLANEFKFRQIQSVNVREGYIKDLSLRTPEELIMD